MPPRVLFAALFVLTLLPSFVTGQSEDGYNSNQRIARIRQLGKTDPQAISSLAAFLKDPDSDIRVEAVKAITKLGSEQSLTPLIEGTKDKDSEVEIRSTDGLVNFYVPGYVTKGGLSGHATRGVRQVKSFFSSRNEQVIGPEITVRPDVAQALGEEVMQGSGIDPRSNAARAAGILRAAPAVSALSQGLRSRDSQLIFECLVALQKVRDPSAGPSVSFLARDLDDRIQATALETIGVLHSLQSAPDVRSALKNARNARIRRAAIQSLAMLGVPGDRQIFQQYESDSDDTIRAAAIEGLGRVREPEDTPTLEVGFNEPNTNWKTRLAAAFALVSEGKVDNGEFSPLSYLVENLDASGRQDVATAYLTELCRRADVRKAIVPLVSKASPEQKVSLCGVLSASKEQDVVPVLTELVKDINPNVSMAASRGLKMIQARQL